MYISPFVSEDPLPGIAEQSIADTTEEEIMLYSGCSYDTAIDFVDFVIDLPITHPQESLDRSFTVSDMWDLYEIS